MQPHLLPVFSGGWCTKVVIERGNLANIVHVLIPELLDDLISTRIAPKHLRCSSGVDFMGKNLSKIISCKLIDWECCMEICIRDRMGRCRS
jgi:hypothetical protein